MDARALDIVVYDAPVPYGWMLEEQHRTRAAVQSGARPNTLFLLEHEAVISCGRNAHEDNILLSRERLATLGVAVHTADRGGDVTYHGPGQLVAYPILNLNQWKPSVGWYLRSLEQVLIALLRDYGLQGERVEGMTGVWVNGAKVAAIGVGVHQWVSFHGIALNVSANLEHFGFIVPCGIADKPVASLRRLLPSPPTLPEVRAAFVRHFQEVFEVAGRDATRTDLDA
ncbi:MAG: lipoyl(octanoyl) transferase LipB [Candidatus Hydrogenedentes bacterium]|nr:lipoyl(octanoyl) transferase LipB [Candidatus Hydrogenedentota bacterium]